VSEQIPQKLPSPDAVTENSIVLAWQLGNMYMLMALLGLFVLNSTSEVKVVRSYLWALWLGDIGHVAFSCYALGRERMMNPAEWNAMTWGNVAFTVSIFSSAARSCSLFDIVHVRYTCQLQAPRSQNLPKLP
jgi:hypothetical protein